MACGTDLTAESTVRNMKRRNNGRRTLKVGILGVMVVSMNFTTGCAMIGMILQIVSAALSISPATRGAGQIVGMVGQGASRVAATRRYNPGTSRNSAGTATSRTETGLKKLTRTAS